MAAEAFEAELNSITQAISLSDFVKQYVQRYFTNCRLYCFFSNNSLRHIAISSIDSEFNHKLYNVWPMNPIKFSDYDDDSEGGLTIRVYDNVSYRIE